MSDVFIAYKSEDRARIEPLLVFLRAHGVDVWVDDYLDATRDWRPQVEAQIDRARAVIVCWTDAACASPFVMEEASRGSTRGVLVAVRLGAKAHAPPLSTPRDVDLSDWRLGSEHRGASLLLKHLKALIGRPLKRASPQESALAAQQQQ